jgi:ubiquinone/menaquinone biosynthesis C-methylase UbiE
MSDFEKEYYEDEAFWGGDMLQDPANTERIRFTAEFIPKEVKSVADIGCGNGVFVNYLKENAAALDILAIDRSLAALKYVKTAKKQGDIAAIPLADRAMDCTCCLEVIEHLPNAVYEKALDELARVSDKYVIISVPFRERLEESYNQCPSCTTIFNFELHLRNFDDAKMRDLLSKRGFSHVESHHLGPIINYKGHYTFRKIFYRDQFLQWRSPICPVCGFKEQGSVSEPAIHPKGPDGGTGTGKRRLISYFTGLPRLFWPKQKRYYWIIALYKRTD